MPYAVLGINDQNERVALPYPSGSWTDYDTDTVGSVSNITVGATLTSSTKIDVYRNGQMLREGVSHDFVRNTSLNRVEFSSPVYPGSWIRVRVFS